MDKFHQLGKATLAIILILLFVAIFMRGLLFLRFPIMLTADSWDYIDISEDIYNYARFSFYSLGDWRLPMYPLFLVLIRAFAPLDAVNIVFAQIILGLGCVVLGILIGRINHSYTTAVIMALFLSFNPVYLLYEHLVMTESLFLFTLLGFTLIAIFCMRNQPGWWSGFLLGSSASLCMLTRANGLFFCLPMIVFVVWRQISFRYPHQLHTQIINKRVHYLLAGIMIGFLLVFTPWLWRNYKEYGHVTLFTHNTNLNMLAYMAEHNLIDTSLSSIKNQNINNSFTADYPGTIYNLIWELRSQAGIVKAEQLAGVMLKEQLNDHLEDFYPEIWSAALNFGGYPILPDDWNARINVRNWFDNLIDDVSQIHKANQSFYGDSSSTYIESRADSPVNSYWALTGSAYLQIFRPILFTAFIFSFIFAVFFFRYLPHINPALMPLSLSYIAVILAHSLTLADYDRFSTPFDWIPLLVICLIVKEFVTYHRSKGYRRGEILSNTLIHT